MTEGAGDVARAAKNEIALRELNERLEAHNRWADRRFSEWVCECADEACAEPVELSIEEYEAVRAEPRAFSSHPTRST